MLDPLSALGVAGNAVQFVEFIWDLLNGARRIYRSKSGLDENGTTLEIIAQDVMKLSDQMTASEENFRHASQLSSATSKEVASTETLRKLVTESRDIAKELLGGLDSIRRNSRNGKHNYLGRRLVWPFWRKVVENQGKESEWRSLLAALKAVWKKGEIDKFVDRLGKVQAQISMHLCFMISEHMKKQSAMIKGLGQQTASLGMEAREGIARLELLQHEIMDKLKSISQEGEQTQVDMKRALEQLETTSSVQVRLGVSHEVSRWLQVSIQNLNQKQSTISKNLSILQSMYFTKIEHRERRIETAHSETFEWVFKSSLPDSSTPLGFWEWLTNGNGTFWIQGKAGSGKSTLMKFIVNHPKTKSLLTRWAGNQKFVMASFFFWNSGNSLQKSRRGLLRSLLFEILRKCPDLIPFIEATNEERLKAFHQTGQYEGDEELWSHTELMEAFQKITEQTHKISTKYCFFIDGLDEFEEDQKSPYDLIDTLTSLEFSTNIKFCVSSRPWIVFSDAFGENPNLMLKLEDLTRGDIHRFVTDKFNESQQFRKMSKKSPAYAELINEVTRLAKGVFLWVFLVVRDLLEGFSHSDTIRTLQKRLASFPEDLEGFFQHMMDSIPKIYLPQTARTIWMATTLSEPEYMMVYSLMDDASDDLPLLIRQSQSVMTESEVNERAEQMRRRLDGRCKGLLEIVPSSFPTNSFFSSQVDFLHRTVRDFLLNSPDIRRMFEEQRFIDLDQPGWLLPCAAIHAVFKSCDFKNTDAGYLAEKLAYTFFLFAHKVEVHLVDTRILCQMLDDIETIYGVNSRLHHWGYERDTFVRLACRAGVTSYCETHDFTELSKIHLWYSDASSLLGYALQIRSSSDGPSSSYIWNTDPRMVWYLLENGAFPNFVLSRDAGIEDTPWRRFITSIYFEEVGADSRIFKTVKILLQFGADLNIQIQSVRGNQSLLAQDVIREVFKGNQADVLLETATKWQRNQMVNGPKTYSQGEPRQGYERLSADLESIHVERPSSGVESVERLNADWQSADGTSTEKQSAYSWLLKILCLSRND